MSDPIFNYWQEFCRKNEIHDELDFEAYNFGDSPILADKLADLVLRGKKTATSSGLALYEIEGDDLPQIDDYAVILNSHGEPICVIQTKTVEILDFGNVSAKQAKQEGEGDLSLSFWRQAHQAFLQPIYQELGLVFNNDTKIVYETFQVVYK